MAGAGSVVLVAALLLFVLVPRQVDRTLAAALREAPPFRDTVALLTARDVAERTRAAMRAERERAPAVRDSLAAVALPPEPVSSPVPVPVDAELLALQGQIDRAKQAPLVESYRALLDSRALREDRVARITLDSIELLHGEREAWAALGGPDARYAALTEQLTRLGARLVQRAERALAARLPAAGAADTSRAAAVVPDPDSLLTAAVEASDIALARAESALVAARVFNASTQRTREALRTRLQVAIPPQAMLLASLILAAAGGFAAALWRELRQPTVGDDEELETVTRSRVIVHRADTGRRGAAKRAAAPAEDDEAWTLLHVLLTRIGDVSRQVQVVADQPALAEVVAFRLAATAARASRATVLVDAVAGGLSLGEVASGSKPRPTLPAAEPATALASDADPTPWLGPRPLVLERDVALDLIRPRELRRSHGARRTVAAQNASASLAPTLQQYDLAVLVSDAPAAPMLPPGADLVLCARRGVTPLAWVTRAVRAADAEGRPVRAVVLWSGELPLVG
jgi:hypothetical protein